MHFALINNERTEAQSGLKGTCPLCSGHVIAKCGNQRLHHWAHKSNKTCDSWWEPETEWHRAWKNNFPVEWQEVIIPDDQTGEKHIADIETSHGIVIEFQHSHLDPKERASREKFHKNMIWVVDGTRLKRDYPRFIKGIDNFKPVNGHDSLHISLSDECFPQDWLDSRVPVIFDYMGSRSSTDAQDEMRNTLWCLLPGRAEGNIVIVAISRQEFLRRTLNHSQLFLDSAYKLVDSVVDSFRQQRRAAEQKLAEMYSEEPERLSWIMEKHFPKTSKTL